MVGACQLSTVQLDVEDAERYGIVYADKDGEKKGCIICHCSIGSIERWIYIVLEDALKKEKHEIQFWLAPTQIRLIPVREEFAAECEKIAEKLKGMARVDIDDRNEKLGRKIRDAGREWINMVIVVGEKEINSRIYPVRLRDDTLLEVDFEQLMELVRERMREYPFRELSLPLKLSGRITFRG